MWSEGAVSLAPDCSDWPVTGAVCGVGTSGTDGIVEEVVDAMGTYSGTTWGLTVNTSSMDNSDISASTTGMSVVAGFDVLSTLGIIGIRTTNCRSLSSVGATDEAGAVTEG